MEVNNPLSSASKISLRPEGSVKNRLKFSKNEVVEGKVLESLPSGKVSLLIKGRRITANSGMPISQGKVLLLKVEEILPVPSLKLLGIKFQASKAINIPTILSAIKENLWKAISENRNLSELPKGAVTKFKELMDDVSMRSFFESKPEAYLKKMIDKSGLSWEAKLRKALIHNTVSGNNTNKIIEGDLKGLASKWLTLNKEKGVILKRFVSTIQNVQLLNQTGLEQDRKIFLPIPIQWPGGSFAVGQLLMHLPEKGEDESQSKERKKDVFRVSFLLELSHLGPLRADLTIKDKEIEGRFLLTKEETRRLVEKNIPIFIDSMKERGFSIGHMACHLKDAETVKEPLIKEIIHEEGSSVSLIA